MTVLNIRLAPDPVLRRKAKRVGVVDASVKKLVDDMLQTIHEVPGRVGLAAPQVGISLRIFVIGVPTDDETVDDYVLINPEVVRRSGERVVDEGCLSIPGYTGQIKRSVSVTVKGLDRNGKLVRIKGEELLAQALEHELDHLNGILYIDHLASPDDLRKIEPEAAETSSQG